MLVYFQRSIAVPFLEREDNKTFCEGMPVAIAVSLSYVRLMSQLWKQCRC